MKKYLKELEIAGIILMGIGIVVAHTAGYNYGMWPCAVGMLVLLLPYLYKAFHWKEYARDNKQNILMMLFVIAMLFYFMLRR